MCDTSRWRVVVQADEEELLGPHRIESKLLSNMMIFVISILLQTTVAATAAGECFIFYV